MKNTTKQLLSDAIFEILEGREMMSATAMPTAALQNGTLNINSNSNAGTRVQVDFAAGASQITVDVTGKHEAFAAKSVHQIDITTGSGSDYIYINPAIDIPANIHSGNGNDSIRSGAGNDTIISGNGNDLIYGKGGNNVIQTGNGNDTLMGDRGNDSLTVGNGNDSLVGGGGSDHMLAGNGNDTFDAGSSHDTITTGTGHDKLIGGLGNTYLYGKNASPASVTAPAKPTNPTAPTTPVVTKPTNPTTPVVTKPSTPTTPITVTAPNTPITTTPAPVTIGSILTPISTGNAQANHAPVATIKMLVGPRITGLVVSVDGLTSTVGDGQVINTMYNWDFGDTGGTNSQMTGYNAAHVYDKAGTYTITLTVTNENGLISKATQSVTIAASARNQIFVDSVNGSDSNRGTQNAPLQSVAAAFAQIGNNTEILLKAGDTFQSTASLHINNTNVLVGRYGAGINPIIMRIKGNGLSTIMSSGSTNGMTIQDITIDSPYGGGTNARPPKIGLGGIFLGGTNVCVRDCTFKNVDDAINENGNPVGVLIQDNSAPLAVGLRGYMIWGQGSEQVIIGNYAANTAQEHIVRLVGLSEVNVQDNNFTNTDGKGCIEMHEGQYGWIVGNTVHGGDIRVGPLGLWGESAASQTSNVVIEDNQLTDTFIYVQSGTHHAMIANNVITDSAGHAIELSGVDAQLRTSSDINIIHNTAIDTGTQGNFLGVAGWVTGITLTNNLWIAPNIKLGVYNTTPVYVDDTDLSCFTQISGNVWPSPVTTGTYAKGGFNFVGTSYLSENFLSAAAWNAQSNVGTDTFQNVKLTNSYEISINSQLAGAGMKIAA